MTHQPDVPNEAELATIKRGAVFVLVGFVLSLVASLVFAGAELFLDNPTASAAPRLRPPEVPDPDFAYLLPILMVALVAVLIEAGGKIMALSRPERWSYGLLHVSLAFDLLATVGVMLKFFNYGRTAGSLLVVIEVIRYCSFGSPAAMVLFVARLSGRLGRRRPVTLAWVFFISTAAAFSASLLPMPVVEMVGPGKVERDFWDVLPFALAGVGGLTSIGTYLAILAATQGLRLPASPPPAAD